MKNLHCCTLLSPRVLSGISLALTAFLGRVNCGAESANLPGDWPTFGNGPAHTGYFPGTLNGLPFVYKWKTPMPNSHITQTAIGGGRAFVTSGWYYGPMVVIALDANTGQPLWTNKLGSSYAINPPTYSDGSVYIQQSDSTGRTYSFDAATGATNWVVSFSGNSRYYMAPLVADGTVYANTGYYVDLTAYNQTDGGVRFSVHLIGNGCDKWTPAYYGGKPYTWVNGYFAEHDPLTGARNYTLTNATQDEFPYSMDRTVAIADGRAYFTSTTKLMAVDLALGQNLWAVNGAFSGTPAVANGCVYAISNGVVAAYTTNGVYLNTYRGTNGSSFSGELIVTDDSLIVAGSYGVYVFKLSDGSIQQYITSYRPAPSYAYYSSTISLANNTLYIASGDGNLYAHSAENLLKFTVANTGGAYGSPSPDPYGINYVLPNSTVTNSVTSPVSGPTGTRYLLTGWTGTGSVPPAGATNTVSFVAASESSLTWNWQTQYWLDTAVVSSGTVDVADSWRTADENVTITATPAPYYHFVNWSGDATGTAPVAQVAMTAPRAVTANFAANLVTNGVPEWWLVQYGLPVSDAGALADADTDGMANWQEYRAGTDPTNRASVLVLAGSTSLPGQLTLRWPSVAGHTYRLWSTTNLSLSPFLAISTNYATPPTNVHTRTIGDSPGTFYRIEVQ